MKLYRANPHDGVAWITGGSSGLGRALAKQLAADGFTVAVTAREEDPIDILIAEANALPGRILAYPCDVTDERRMNATVSAIEAQLGPIALAIFNAGSYVPIAGENLSVRKFRNTYNVNVLGIVHGLVPVARQMQSRGRGHVVMVGSVSAWFGWPTTAAYGATKAAVNVMAQSLKFDFDKINIRIQVINPGFIDTPLTQKNGFVMPALMTPANAAQRMAGIIRSGGFESSFPRRLAWGLRFLSILPVPVCHWIVGQASGWKRRPLSFGRRPPKR